MAVNSFDQWLEKNGVTERSQVQGVDPVKTKEREASSFDRWKARYASDSNVDVNYINQYLSDHQNYWSGYGAGMDEAENRNYRLDERRASIDSWLSGSLAAGTIDQSYYDQISGILGEADSNAQMYQGQRDLTGYLTDWGDWYNTSSEALGTMDWNTGRGGAAVIDEAVAGFADREAAAREWLETYKDRLGPEYYSSMTEYLDSMGGQADQLRSAYDQNAAYFGQWGSQEEYDRYGYLSGMSLGQEEQRVSQMESDVEEMERLEHDINFSMMFYSEEDQAYIRQRYRQLQRQYGANAGEAARSLEEARANLKEAGQLQEGIAQAEKIRGWEDQYSGMSYYDLTRAMENVTDESERAWLQSYAPTVMTDTDYGWAIGEINTALYPLETSLEEMLERQQTLQQQSAGYSRSHTIPQEQKDAVAEELEQLNVQIADTQAQIEALKGQKWTLENDRQYRLLNQNEDWAEKSKVSQDEATAGFGISLGKNWLGTGDAVYDYINFLDGTKEEHLENNYNPDTASPYWVYDYMTDDERASYNYLYNTGGKEAAEEYLGYLEYTLNERHMDEQQRTIAAFAERLPRLASAVSVPMNLMSGIGALDVAGQNVVKGLKESFTGEYAGPVDYNRSAMGATVATSTIRGIRAQQLADKYGTIQLDPEKYGIVSKLLNGKSLGDVYQLGMSMLDSAAVAALSPYIGSAGTYLLGGSAASQGILDAVANGATDEQALAMGILNGAFEVLFEKYELEHLLGADSNMLKALLNQALTEGIGEGSTTLANNIADFAVMGENSNLMRTVAAYMEQGLSQEDAMRKALLDSAIQVGWDAVGGLLSGSIMGAGISAENAVSSRIQQSKLPYQVQQSAERLRSYGVDQDTALQTAALLYEQGQVYGDQLDYFMKAYDPRGDAAQYAVDFRTAWEIGRNNGNREYIAKTSLTDNQGQIAYNLGASAARAATAKASKSTTESSGAQAGSAESQESGQSVQIREFSSVGQEARVVLEDGKTVSAQSVSYGSADEAALYETIGTVSGSADTANRLLKNYRSSGISASDYAAGLQQAYDLGMSGQVPERQLGSYELAGMLPVAARSAAFGRGRTVGAYKAAAKQATTEARGRQVKGEKEGRLHFDRKGRTFSKTQEASLGAMEALSKALGIDIYVYESYTKGGARVYQDRSGAETKAPNGWYDPDTGAIHIDLNAGNFCQGTMMFTLAHELTHFIREWSPVKFRKLAQLLVDRYGEQGVSVRELIDGQIAKARENGRSIDRDTAFEEVVADSMETMLTRGDAAAFMAELKQQDKTLWQKVRDWFKDLARKLQAVADQYSGASPESTEGRLVARMEDFIGVLQQAYSEALVEAAENYRANEGEKNTTREGGVKYQARPTDKETVRIKAVIQAASSDLNRMDPVANVSTTDLTKMNTNQRYKWAVDILKATGYKVDRQDFGTIAFSEKQINTGMNYLNDAGEFAAFAALPRVLKRGKIIHDDNNHKGRNFGTVIIAAPVVINGVRGNMGVALQKTTSTHYHTHRILMPDGSAFEFKNNAAPTPSGDLAKTPIIAATISTASKNTVPQQKSGVKPKSEEKQSARVNVEQEKLSDRDSSGNELTKEQQEYFRNSVVRDAQGRLMVMYHGTPKGGFTVFDTEYGSYFTSDKRYAELYTRNGGERAKVYGVYLNITKPFDTRNAREKRIFQQEFFGKWGNGTPLSEAGLPDWTDGNDLVEFLKEKGYDYDGVVISESNAGSYEEVSYAIMDPNQAKEISNKTPTDNPDIRFSDRDPTAAATAEALEKQNAKLRQDVAELRELLRLQGKLTHGGEFSKTSVEAAVRLLSQTAGATLNAEGRQQLYGMLKDFYRYIATDKELAWEGVSEEAGKIADFLMDHVRVKPQRSDYANDVLQYLRGQRVALSDSQRAEVERLYGYENYRKMLFGAGVYLSKDGMSLDSLWHEASNADMFPGTFDSQVTEGDQPEALLSAIDAMRSSDLSMIEYAYNREGIRAELARAVYDSYWRADNASTVADRKQKEINEIRRKHRERMENLKESHRETIQQLKEKRRSDIEAVRREYRERNQKQLQEQRDRYEKSIAQSRERRDAVHQREVVEKNARALMDMLSRPRKEAHVPLALQGPLEKFLNSIDFSSKRALKGGELTIRDVTYTRALDEVRTAIAGQRSAMDGAEDGTFNLDVPKEFLDMIGEHISAIYKSTEELDGDRSRVYEMTSGELKQLATILKTINAAVRQIDRLHMAGAKARVSELARDTVKEMEGRDPVKTEKGGTAMWANYTPTFAFERMGRAATQILDGLKKGQAKLARTAAAVIKFAGETYTGKEVKAWEEETHDITLDSGKTVKMSTAQIMSFYCLSHREQAKGHMTGGGIRIGNIGEGRKTIRQTEHFRLTQEDISRINGLLTKRQREVADKLQRYMADVGGRLGNEISMARWDYMEMTDRDYFPIRSDADIHDARNPDQDKTNLWALLNKSFTKAVVRGAKDAMVVSSIFNVFSDHMSEMAEYNAFALPLVDAMKWYNYRETQQMDGEQIETMGVQKAIKDTLGTEAGKYFIDLMTDINSSQKAGRYENFFGKLLSRSKGASVGWNLRVAIQQPTAILRAMVYLDPGSLARGTLRIRTKQLVDEMQKYSGIALWKSLGYYDLNISRGVKSQIKGDTTMLDQLNDAGMWLPGKMDEWTWARIWASCKDQVRKNKKLTGEALLEETAKLFEDVVYHTQVADSVLTRSSLMRSKSQTVKELTSFMAEPTLSVNLLMSAFQDYREGASRGEKVKRALRIGFYGYALSAIANALIISFVDAERDDDEYEGYWEKYFQALLGEKFVDGNLFAELNPLEKIVFVRDILSMLRGYEGTKNPFVELAESGISLIQNVGKFFRGESQLTAYGLIYQSLQVLGSFTGAAPANLLREVTSLWNSTFGKWNNMMIHRYKTTDKSEIRSAYLAGALTWEEAEAALVKAGTDANDAYFLVKEWDTGESGKYGDVFSTALAGGDITEAVAELTAHGMTEKEVLSSLKSQIGKWYYDPESDIQISREEARRMLEQYSDLKPEEIEAQLNKWELKLETGISYSELKEAFLDENITEAEALDYLQKYGGLEEEDALERVKEWKFEADWGFSYDDVRNTYQDRDITREEALQVLMEDGGMLEADAEARIRKWDCKLETGYEYEDLEELYVGKKISAEKAISLRVEYGGQSQDDARKTVLQWQMEIDTGYKYDDLDSAYVSGNVSEGNAVKWLVKYGEKDEETAGLTVQAWKWRHDNPQYKNLGYKQIDRYLDYCVPSGVSIAQFYEIAMLSKRTENDKDENGNSITYSAVRKVMAAINALPITRDQKEAIAKAMGWADKTIRKCRPW